LPITPYSTSSSSSPERMSSSSPPIKCHYVLLHRFCHSLYFLAIHHHHYRRFYHLLRLLQLSRRGHCLIKHHCLVNLIWPLHDQYLDIQQPSIVPIIVGPCMLVSCIVNIIQSKGLQKIS
jgi:hypothetical protein